MKSIKSHVLCIPYPAQGHIISLLTLAKLLHSKNFHVTFVHTEYNKAQLLRTHGPDALGEQPDFRFETVPDGVPDLEAERNDSMIFRTMAQSPYIEPLKALLTRINDAAAVSLSDVPPVTCIITDYILYPVLDVAQEFGLQSAVYMGTGVTTLMAFSLFEKLVQEGLLPFKDDDYMINGQIDKVINCVPGVSDFRLRDLPSFARTTDRNPFVLQFFINLTNQLKKAPAIIFSSFDAIEQDALRYLSSHFPPLYTIGPMQLAHNGEKNKLIKSNLLKEDSECLSWLDSFAPRSVLYVNFGSTTTMTKDTFTEFAMGLANSKHPFLWVIRPTMVIGDDAILPSKFHAETKERCMITSWCNQEQVLAHPSIGAFLTHNGWNSTVESVYNAVPMICWPFVGDQQPYCWLACKKWGVGLEIDPNVTRSQVEEKVREMMEGETGIEMARKALEWKTLAHKATLPPNGSSYINLDKVIKLLVTKA